MSARMPGDKPRTIVVRQDNNGDVLLTGPAVRALGAGSSHLTYVCGPRGRAAAAMLPGVDALIVAEAAWIDADPKPVDERAIDELVEAVALMRPDIGVVFTSFHQSPLPAALLLKVAGVPFTAAISVDYPGSLLDVRHSVSDDIHEVERALSLARAAGFDLPPGDDGRLRVAPDTHAGTLAQALARPYVVVNPGATVTARAWQPEKNAALVDALAARGANVVVTGAPAERALTRQVAGMTGPGVTDLGGETSWEELAGVLAHADVLVCGNTGPAHLAAAVGTPVVSIFAPTIPASRFRPWGVEHVLLGDQTVPCAGCRARTCPLPTQICTAQVRIPQVIDAIEQLAPDVFPSAIRAANAGAR